ncbi:MAG: tRNA(Met) cytidine acetyltransferase TmcA [Desulfurococcaceae archaeon]
MPSLLKSDYRFTSRSLPSSFKRFMRDLGKLSERLIRARVRVLIALSGSDPTKLGVLASKLVNYYAGKWYKLESKKELTGLYVYHDEFPDAVKIKEVFEAEVSSVNSVDFEYSVYEKSEKYLGVTVQFLVMDLTKDLKPNDVGRLVGIVEGGGIIVFLTPPWETWDTHKTIFKETLTVPQFPEPRHVFITWIKKKLLDHDGIGVYDADNNRVIKKLELRRELKPYTRTVNIPKERSFPSEVYEHALTIDQVNVIKVLEYFYEKPKKGAKKVFVLTADRGRGKSCAVGIGVVGLLCLFRKVKPRFRVLVTSPEPGNVQSLMSLAMKVLDKLGYKYDVVKRGGNVVEVRGERFSIEYWEPLVIPKLKGDIVVVDEAAGIHVPLLYKILEAHNRVVFSTTIHGYEGAGRGFSVRFLRRLKSMEGVELYQYEMSEPIRYNYDDPVEEWLFKALLLDAEPVGLDEEDLKDIEAKRLVYTRYEPGELFENEEELRQLFGIYVLAHYRNEPDDLGMLADAPHHIVRAIKTTSGKVVCAVQIAQEGPIDPKMIGELLRGGKIPGNIIPDRFLKHARLIEFANTAGWRIVRIATHPAVQGKGVGSWALEKVFEEVKERGLDWLGSGFGVTEELLKFWIKNGFSVVHISPDRNPVSGEYTVLVIKPANEKAAKLVEIAKLEFKLKLLNSISVNYRELEPEVAYLMLDADPYFYHERPPAPSLIAIDRLWTYCTGPMTFEAAADLMYTIAKLHWLVSKEARPQLNRLQELLLITRALQGLSWDEAASMLKKPVKTLQEAGHEIACIYFEYFTGLKREAYKPGVSISSYKPGIPSY